MITICMNDAHINGEAIRAIEIWNTLDRTNQQGVIIALIPVEHNEVVRVTNDVLRIGSTEEGQPTVILQ